MKYFKDKGKTHVCVLFFSVMILANCFAQKLIVAEFDKDNCRLVGLDSNQFKKGNSYIIRVEKINRVFIDTEYKTGSVNLIQKIPESLKPYFNFQVLGSLNSLNVGGDSAIVRSIDSIYQISIDNISKISELHNKLLDEKNKCQSNLFDCGFDLKSMSGIIKNIFNGINTSDFENEILTKYFYSKSVLVLLGNYLDNIQPGNQIFHSLIEKKSKLEALLLRFSEKNMYKDIEFFNDLKGIKDDIQIGPINIVKDLFVLELDLIDKLTGDTLCKINEKIYPKNEISLNFSSGLYLNNLTNSQYYLSRRNDETNFIFEENTWGNDIVAGALLNLNFLSISKINTMLNLNIGASISIFTGKPKFLTGTGLVIGNPEKIAINFGYIWGAKINLSNSVLFDGSAPFISSSISKIPTYTNIERGGYLGFSYFIFSAEKE